jgi:hypothetical protein
MLILSNEEVESLLSTETQFISCRPYEDFYKALKAAAEK